MTAGQVGPWRNIRPDVPSRRAGFALGKPPTARIQTGRFQVRGMAMIRATVVRALVLTAAVAAALTPVTCLGQASSPAPAKASTETPPKAPKPLPAKATQ